MRTSENNHLSFYYTNKKTREKVDKLLHKNAMIQSNLGIDSTDSERNRADKEVGELVKQIKGLDEEFAKKVFVERVKRRI